ncbi:MAG: thioredoxin domain-containing protein [Syntrophales bacterium]|nr:thioredoxin domain-containing protein [Syntrophales bacterium]MDD5234347.1 thioredoxin domain-containing protein [Syntrophales bacterium]MDD5532925.1 thioredoxin domain-containing protein [Syntrophales bacterium]
MKPGELIIRCLKCGRRNRIRSDRFGSRPICGTCRSHLDDLIVKCFICGTMNRIPEERLQDRPICGRCRMPLYRTSAEIVGDDTFEREVLFFPGTVLVACWAFHRENREELLQFFNRLSSRFGGGIKIARLNPEKSPSVAARYEIRDCPSLLVIRNGKKIAYFKGVPTMEEITEIIKK